MISARAASRPTSLTSISNCEGTLAARAASTAHFAECSWIEGSLADLRCYRSGRRLQAVQKFYGAIGNSGRREHGCLVIFQNLQPVGNVICMIVAGLPGEVVEPINCHLLPCSRPRADGQNREFRPQA